MINSLNEQALMMVADAIALFAAEGTRWMTGNVIRVDGGEDISA